MKKNISNSEKKPKILWAFLFVVVLIILTPYSLFAQDAPDQGSSKGSDFWQYAESQHWTPFVDRLTERRSGEFAIQGVLLSLVASPSDGLMRSQWVNHQQMSKNIADIGDFWGTGIPEILVASGHSIWAPEKASSLWRSFFYTGIVTGVLKLSVGKKRPGSSQDRQSFPSGHTSTSFAMATSLSMMYGAKAGWFAFPMAVLTGFSRMADDAHWWSDVIAGAYIGILVARAATYDESSMSGGISDKEEGFFWYPTFETETQSGLPSADKPNEGRVVLNILYQF